jgi:hypothetical protein
MTVGILAFGAYIPRLRLQRRTIADANAWFNAALKGRRDDTSQGRIRPDRAAAIFYLQPADSGMPY